MANYNAKDVARVVLGKGLCPLESPVGSLRNLNEINGLGKRERNPRFRPYNGLSTVHIRPTTPSYTPPQLQFPGIRDTRRDYPFENLSVQCGTTPSTSNTSIQRPLARHRVLLSRRVVAYYGLIRASESLPATSEFAAEAAAPKENRLEVGIQRVPN